jgi:hypothetical protein
VLYKETAVALFQEEEANQVELQLFSLRVLSTLKQPAVKFHCRQKVINWRTQQITILCRFEYSQ